MQFKHSEAFQNEKIHFEIRNRGPFPRGAFWHVRGASFFSPFRAKNPFFNLQ